MLLQGVSQRESLTLRDGLGADVIAALHTTTKSDHVRNPSVASDVVTLVITSDIVAFGLPLLPIELTPQYNVTILNKQWHGMR
jgi:hypothetical protein